MVPQLTSDNAANSWAEMPRSARAARKWAPERLGDFTLERFASLYKLYSASTPDLGARHESLPLFDPVEKSNPGEKSPPGTPAADQPVLQLQSVEKLIEHCRGAYADVTLRNYRADLKAFARWCAKHDRSWLPADADTIGAFLTEDSEAVATSTLKRRLSAIVFAHRYSDLPCPSHASAVQLALRRAARKKAIRPVQAKGLTAEILAQILAACGDDLLGRRDAAIIAVGYDTLCRACEIVAMRVEHLQAQADGSAAILIPRGKADAEGAGRIAWLSPKTARLLQDWLEISGVSGGPIFRSVHMARAADVALDECSVRRLVKRAAKRAAIEPALAAGLTGHSMRVGAAQEMLEAGFDAAAIMTAGGWKTQHVLLRYVENASTQSLHTRRWKALGAT